MWWVESPCHCCTAATPHRDVTRSCSIQPLTPARVRAMYTAPALTRRGVGWLILGLCERAAAAERLTWLELMGTMSGQPLYTNTGSAPTSTLRTTAAERPCHWSRWRSRWSPRYSAASHPRPLLSGP